MSDNYSWNITEHCSINMLHFWMKILIVCTALMILSTIFWKGSFWSFREIPDILRLMMKNLNFSTAFRNIFFKYFLKFDCCRQSTYISWSMDNDEHYVIYQNRSVDRIRTNGRFLINKITIFHILDYIWMTCLIIFNISVTRDLTCIPTRSFHLPEWGVLWYSSTFWLASLPVIF